MQVFQDNYLGDRLTIRVSGKNISIDSLPTTRKYNRMLVTIIDHGGNECYKEIYTCGSRIAFTPDIFTPGEYGMRLYAGPASDNMFHSRFGGKLGLPLLFNGKKLSFRASPYTLANVLFVGSIPTSKDFLNECLEPTPYIQSDHNSIRSLAAEIRKGRIFRESLLIGVNDWVASNISYDMDALFGNRYLDDDHSSLAILRNKRGVCSGYHNLTSALLRACGIPTLGISCYSLGLGSKGWWYDRNNMDRETNHIMTAAYVGNRWRLMDVTWDSDLEYRNGKVISKSGLGASRTYCDASIPYISLTHRFDDYEF